MPAAPPFLIPAALAKLGPLHQHDTGRLRVHLQRVPDPRSRRGRWYPLVGLLLICACAVVSGARTITEITGWGQRATIRLRSSMSGRQFVGLSNRARMSVLLEDSPLASEAVVTDVRHLLSHGE